MERLGRSVWPLNAARQADVKRKGAKSKRRKERRGEKKVIAVRTHRAAHLLAVVLVARCVL